MSRTGSGTTTDATNTSNVLRYAGEARRRNYTVSTGTGANKAAKSLTGYTVSADAIAVEVTGGNLATAAPYGTCTVGMDTSMTTEAKCEGGTWVQDTPTALTINTDNLSTGKFYAYIPSTILNTVGYSTAALAPTVGEPVFIAVVAQYQESAGTADAETVIVSADLVGYQWTPMFDPTATA